MADWAFKDDQLENEFEKANKQEGKDLYAPREDNYGNTWVYGRRGWRQLGDYDG